MRGWPTGPGLAPIKLPLWTIRHSFPLSFATTRGCARRFSATSYNRANSETRAPHFAARPSASDSFLPPRGEAVGGGRCHNEVFAERKPELRQNGARKRATAFKAAAQVKRDNRLGEKPRVGSYQVPLTPNMMTWPGS